MPPMPPKCGDLTELVMERRGQAVVVTHNAMPADSTVASLRGRYRRFRERGSLHGSFSVRGHHHMTPAALARRPEKISSPSLVLYRRGEIIYNLAPGRRLIVATKQTQ